MKLTSLIKRMIPSSHPSESQGSYRPLHPTVEWQVAGHCNYDCPYCIQSRAMRVGSPDDSTVESIIHGFGKLPGNWEIKISGGEPFAYKGFVAHAIPLLIEKTSHSVSVLTNFSAPISILKQFCVKTGPRLRITSASFHPDTVECRDFVEKCIQYRDLRSEFNPNSSFVVNVVLVPGKVSNHLVYREILQESGFRYFPQLMKIKGGVFPYNDKERALIEKITEGSHDPMQVNRAPNYHGLHCDAGVWYFVVDQTGEAYTCRTGKRYCGNNATGVSMSSSHSLPTIQKSDDRGRLGSFVRGDFKLLRAGGPCPYTICPCTVPANRGVVRIPIDETVATEDEGDTE